MGFSIWLNYFCLWCRFVFIFTFFLLLWLCYSCTYNHSIVVQFDSNAVRISFNANVHIISICYDNSSFDICLNAQLDAMELLNVFGGYFFPSNLPDNRFVSFIFNLTHQFSKLDYFCIIPCTQCNQFLFVFFHLFHGILRHSVENIVVEYLIYPVDWCNMWTDRPNYR